MKKTRSFLIVLIAIPLFTCTENPFFKDNIDPADGYTLTGTVELNDGASPDSVFIWLEKLNVSDFTDKNGRFFITIPHQQAQPGGGLSGEIKLYYYLGNFRLHTENIMLVRGTIKYDNGNVDRKGTIKSVILKKLADIQTTMEPSTVHIGNYERLRIDYLIQIYNDPVYIRNYIHQRDKNFLTNIFLRPIDQPADSAIHVKRSIFLRTHFLTETQKDWFFEDWVDSLYAPPGVYEVIPYIEVVQDNIPKEMIRAAGGEPDFTDNRWLYHPYKRSTHILEIL